MADVSSESLTLNVRPHPIHPLPPMVCPLPWDVKKQLIVYAATFFNKVMYFQTKEVECCLSNVRVL